MKKVLLAAAVCVMFCAGMAFGADFRAALAKAERGDSDAQFEVGRMYAVGEGVKQDYKKAREWFEKGAAQKNRVALDWLGWLYDNGYGVKQDYKKAREYYEEAAALNNGDALRKLGDMYYFGRGVKQDYKKAVEYYEKGAALNNANALNTLGVMYHDGKGVKQDYTKAREYYEKSAALNYGWAFYNLGNMYYYGRGVKQDYTKAREYYEKAAALNNASAFYNLGYMYAHGNGVKQDYTKAREYYEKSAALNNASALNNLGYMYAHGNGVKQDYTKAREYYEKSAALNNASAFYNLGYMYENAKGVREDLRKARDYYEKAAALNNADAMYELGEIYFEGYGVKEDYAKARDYYEKAAALNNEDAMLKLGELYAESEGLGFKRDYKKALEYYEKAAALNNGTAFDRLGGMYRKGLGVKQDYKKAREYYEKAKANGYNSDSDIKALNEEIEKAKEFSAALKKANRGNVEAMIKVGGMYFSGEGVKQDRRKGLEYFEKAAAKGHKEVQGLVGWMYFLPTNGINQNYKKAREWFEKYVAQAKTDEEKGMFVMLGFMYEYGLGVKKDSSKARELYQKAPSIKPEEVFGTLAYFYLTGKFGIKEDYKKALEYAQKGAALNDASSLCIIGVMYENGIGVTENMNKAIDYYRQAYANGNESAKKALERLKVPLNVPAQKSASVPPAKPQPQPAAPVQNNFASIFMNSNAFSRPRLAVLPFEDRSEGKNAPAAAIINMMQTELHKTGLFTLIEREQLNKLLEEVKFGQSGLVDQATAPKIGRQLGAQYYMTGAITLYYYSEEASGFAFPVLGTSTKAKTAYAALDIRIVNTETGEIVYTSGQTGQATQTSKKSGITGTNYRRMTEGLLSMATLDSVVKHVSAIRTHAWKN